MLTKGTVVGDWVLEAPLGRGAVGQVWSCTHQRFQHLRASLKLVPCGRHDEHHHERFRREVQALLRLRHGHIVGYRGCGVDESTQMYWIAMELVEGPTLEARLKEGPLSSTDAIEVVQKLAGALKHAHTHGVFHRDVKPSNVILSSRGPILVDFGVALQQGDPRLTAQDAIVGTLAYMPPELFMNDGQADPKSWDQYALGVLLYEALTGEQSFETDPALPPHIRQARTIVAKSRAVAMDLPRGFIAPLERIVRTTTAHDPSDRYTDWSDLERAIEAARVAACRLPASLLSLGDVTDVPEPVAMYASGALVRPSWSKVPAAPPTVLAIPTAAPTVAAMPQSSAAFQADAAPRQQHLMPAMNAEEPLPQPQERKGRSARYFFGLALPVLASCITAMAMPLDEGPIVASDTVEPMHTMMQVAEVPASERVTPELVHVRAQEPVALPQGPAVEAASVPASVKTTRRTVAPKKSVREKASTTTEAPSPWGAVAVEEKPASAMFSTSVQTGSVPKVHHAPKAKRLRGVRNGNGVRVLVRVQGRDGELVRIDGQRVGKSPVLVEVTPGAHEFVVGRGDNSERFEENVPRGVGGDAELVLYAGQSN